MVRFSNDSESVLREAGWTPDRLVDVSAWVIAMEAVGVTAHAAAREFLAEFGGLFVDIAGSGVNRARVPFEFDPMQCLSEEDRFLEWGEEVGRSIFPIGILDTGRFFLGLDEVGEMYLLETWLASFGVMPRAMDNLISGVRAETISAG